MKLLIGCPLVGGPSAGRNWILPSWYEHIVRACEVAGVDDWEILVTVHPDDLETQELLQSFAKCSFAYSAFLGGDHDHRWRSDRYETMVSLRNELLGLVRGADPEYFFSLDSDVLLREDAIQSLLNGFEEKSEAWAIGAKCFVSPHGFQHPNNGKWVGAQSGSMFKRENTRELIRVDILICCYMMRPEAYGIDYEYDSRGEDLGWSLAVARAGGKMYWDGRVPNKHVMDYGMLYTVDSRAGF